MPLAPSDVPPSASGTVISPQSCSCQQIPQSRVEELGRGESHRPRSVCYAPSPGVHAGFRLFICVFGSCHKKPRVLSLQVNLWTLAYWHFLSFFFFFLNERLF